MWETVMHRSAAIPLPASRGSSSHYQHGGGRARSNKTLKHKNTNGVHHDQHINGVHHDQHTETYKFFHIHPSLNPELYLIKSAPKYCRKAQGHVIATYSLKHSLPALLAEGKTFTM